ncbi:MAG: hypothetical protein RL653_2528 [Pseudomonadota bacterium]
MLWRRRTEPDFSLQFAGLWVLGLVLCAVGASGMWRQYERGRRFHEVAGTSTRLDFIPETVRGRPAGPRLQRWRVEVAYRYRVGEREWTGTRIHESADADAAWDEGDRAAFEQRFAPGSPLRVYVNPADPADALLEPSVDYHGGVRWLLLGLVLAAAGALLTLGPTRGEEAAGSGDVRGP